jgi:Putative sensor
MTVPVASRPSSGWRALWHRPFQAETWKQTLYALVALPVSLAGVGVTVAGRADRAAGMQRRLARTLLGLVPDPTETTDGERPDARRTPPGRVLAHGLLSLPLNAAVLALTVYLWSIVVLNVAFPVRGTSDLDDSWGGPSLAGAWAVHGVAGLALLFVVPWIIAGLTWLQGRLLSRLLGTDGSLAVG